MKPFLFFVAFISLWPSNAFASDEYVFILTARNNPYWTAMKQGVEETAKADGISATVYEAESDRDAEGELNLCLTAIQRKPKMIVMSSANPSVGTQCFKQALAAGIQVADIDATFPVADAAKAGIALTFSVGADNFAIGEKAADYASRIANKPDAKILVLEGAVGSAPGQKRVDGFRAGLKKLLPQANVVASISGEWDRLKAMNITNDILQRTPDLDIIYAANDMMALGAVEAVRNAEKTSQVKIIGVDGTTDGRKAVMDGQLTATVAQLPYLVGKRAVELAVKAARGEKFDATQTTPAPILTQDVLKFGKEEMLQYVR